MAFSLAPEASPIALTQWKASVFFFFFLNWSIVAFQHQGCWERLRAEGEEGVSG